MLSLENISFSYGKRSVLSSLSFKAEKGECIVLCGPNGSGKSTALSIIAGAVKPSGGRVLLGGRLGYAPQGTALFEDASVGENLAFFASLARCPVPEKLPFGLESRLKKRVSTLSGGMKKQLSIACALLGDPDILLLDEPCDSLDISFRRELTEKLAELKKQGKTIIYVGHEPLEFAGICDTLIYLGPGGGQFSRAQLSAPEGSEQSFCENFRKFFV